MFCRVCGAEIAPGSRFCKKCGAPQRARSGEGASFPTAEDVGRHVSAPGLREQSNSNYFWLWAIVVPVVVVGVLVTMVGAMRPSEKTKAVEFTSPRQISFSGTGPETAKVGVPIEFIYEIANTGTGDFKDFRIAFPNEIEKSFDISTSRPSGTIVSENSKRMLAFGFLGAGQKATVIVTLIPKVEGESEVTATFYDGTAALTNERSKGMVYKKVKVSS